MSVWLYTILGCSLLLLWLFTGSDRDSTLTLGLYFLLVSRFEDMDERL